MKGENLLMKHETCSVIRVTEIGIKVVKYRDFAILSIFMYVYIKGKGGEVLSVIHEV